MRKPLNLKRWIDENRHLLKPPVGNKKIWEDTDFDVFIVGGPNSRKDYHIDPNEEFFYQLEGDMLLKVVEDGVHKDIVIQEGEVFLLPPNIPHSPQRFENTVGLVVEYKRAEGTQDGLRWYCDGCGEVLHEQFFQLHDIVGDLKAAIVAFKDNHDLRTCKKCGHFLEL